MTQGTAAKLIGLTMVCLAIVALVTTVPLGVTQSAIKSASGTAVAPVDSDDCLDVAFTADVTYTKRSPLVDVWGISEVDDVSIDHAVLSVAARPHCSDGLDAVGAIAYINAPVCESGLCEEAHTTYSTSRDVDATAARMTYDGPRPLPGPGVTRAPWCLEFAAEVQHGSGDVGYTDAARTTAADFCLDVV